MLLQIVLGYHTSISRIRTPTLNWGMGRLNDLVWTGMSNLLFKVQLFAVRNEIGPLASLRTPRWILRRIHIRGITVTTPPHGTSPRLRRSHLTSNSTYPSKHSPPAVSASVRHPSHALHHRHHVRRPPTLYSHL